MEKPICAGRVEQKALAIDGTHQKRRTIARFVHGVVGFAFVCFFFFFFFAQILSRNEISDGMVLGQSRYIAKALKRLSKLDDQTGNEIALLADLYFN